jgi:hypothetical protein
MDLAVASEVGECSIPEREKGGKVTCVVNNVGREDVSDERALSLTCSALVRVFIRRACLSLLMLR